MRQLTSIVLILLLCSILMVIPDIGRVKASTDVPSVINLDTTWTKANSPYELKGPMLVSNGITLTVEPGATVNLNDYYIQVNGTLNARGSSTDTIHFNGGIIRLTEYSNNWNEQTGLGCIIENANLSKTSIEISNSPKINNNSIYEISVDGSPTITENTISGRIWTSGSPVILNNSIIASAPGSVHIGGGSPTISHNIINCRIMITSGSPTISDNTINDGIHADSQGGDVQIINNIVNIRGGYYSIFVHGPSATISNNHITGKKNQGIYLSGPYTYFISDNIISNCSAAITANNPCPITIERNQIGNNIDGISVAISARAFASFGQVWKSPPDFPLTIRNNFITDNSGIGISLNHPSATIMNNSITNNQIGIIIVEPPVNFTSPTILYNNIYANEYNLKSGIGENINFTFNWWGTTDIPTINQTIYDFKYDFNLGTVIFIPFLTEPNLEIPEFPSWNILVLGIFTVMLLSMIYRYGIKQREKE